MFTAVFCASTTTDGPDTDYGHNYNSASWQQETKMPVIRVLSSWKRPQTRGKAKACVWWTSRASHTSTHQTHAQKAWASFTNVRCKIRNISRQTHSQRVTECRDHFDVCRLHQFHCNKQRETHSGRDVTLPKALKSCLAYFWILLRVE